MTSLVSLFPFPSATIGINSGLGEQMKIQSIRKGEDLYLFLQGELDEHSVASLRARTDALIDGNAGLSRAVFNLAGVKFMDSTGIGFLMGRYKKLSRYGIRMAVESPNEGADKILLMSGIYSLMPKI